MTKDYYSILGVTKKATQAEIKKAFRKLVMKYHPDKNPDDDAAAKKMVELNEAYAIIGNEKLRKEYDQISVATSRGKSSSSKPYGYRSANENHRRSQHYKNAQEFYQEYNFESAHDFFNRTFDAFEDTFNELFGIPKSREDLIGDLYLSPDEAIKGCRKQFVFERPILCPSCYGNSVINDFMDCPTCRNIGKVLLERNLWITIPPKTPNLGRVRLKNEGAAVNNHEPGDLILTIRVTEDGKEPENPDFDFHMKMNIDLEKAVIGGPITVRPPAGPIRIQLPKWIYPGKIIRVKNEGQINPDTLKRGHLYITFGVNFPKDPTRTQQTQMEKLMEKAG